ncbi:hypothetical protein RND81_10G033700 [Saponaria officinalis]|uniref:Uncharacterized protein n=1 Tax=Saponaria officinalis TaxID=3572 RepID=A0AAW1HY22_SAPOF
MMGFARTFGWMNKNVCKIRQCRSLFWRIKAVVKKRVKSHHNLGKKNVKFQYDPSSYALNFDEGVGGGGSSRFMSSTEARLQRGEIFINGDDEKINENCCKLQFMYFLDGNSTWVYVFIDKKIDG